MPHVRREQSDKSSSHAICSGPLECKSHLPPSGLTSAAGLGELKSPLRALASTSAFCGAIHDGLQARQQKQRRRSSYSRLYSFLSGPVGARPKLREKVFYKRESIFEDSARARLRVASSTSLRATRGQQHISLLATSGQQHIRCWPRARGAWLRSSPPKPRVFGVSSSGV